MGFFITGATGTVGREVSRALLARGADVRVGARRSSAVSDVLPGVRDVVRFDFEHASIDPAVFEGVDALFFMTPLMDDQVTVSRRVDILKRYSQTS